MPEKRRPNARTRRALAIQRREHEEERLAHEEARAAEQRLTKEHTANMMLHTAALLQEAAKVLQPSNAAMRRSPEDEPDPRQTSTKRTLSADDPVNDLSADSWPSSRSVFKGLHKKMEEVWHVRGKSDLPDEKKASDAETNRSDRVIRTDGKARYEKFQIVVGMEKATSISRKNAYREYD